MAAQQRSATTVWQGSLGAGSGRTSLDSSGVGTFDVSWPRRTEDPEGTTSPEELLAAAHASCFSMAMSKQLEDRGGAPDRLETSATVTIDKTDAGFTITAIVLRVTGSAPGVEADAFREAAEAAKDGCPVSRLFAGGSAEITLEAAPA
jgi:lipoyl-dependent peroxiredoxin